MIIDPKILQIMPVTGEWLAVFLTGPEPPNYVTDTLIGWALAEEMDGEEVYRFVGGLLAGEDVHFAQEAANFLFYCRPQDLEAWTADCAERWQQEQARKGRKP